MTSVGVVIVRYKTLIFSIQNLKCKITFDYTGTHTEKQPKIYKCIKVPFNINGNNFSIRML